MIRVEDLSCDEYTEYFSDIVDISRTLTASLNAIADKYNVDRDDVIRHFLQTNLKMVENRIFRTVASYYQQPINEHYTPKCMCDFGREKVSDDEGVCCKRSKHYGTKEYSELSSEEIKTLQADNARLHELIDTIEHTIKTL